MQSKFKVGDMVLPQKFESKGYGPRWQDWLEPFINKQIKINGIYEDNTALLGQWRWPLSALVKVQSPEDRLRDAAPALLGALQEAIAAYGKEGGPWNVPSEPGTWIAMAKAAITAALGTEKEGV